MRRSDRFWSVNASQRRATVVALGGTVLQWYDFSLFGLLASKIAATHFPAGDHFAGVLATFAIFAVGFCLAPLGALFFGAIGDRHGRKAALTLSMLIMLVPTLGMAILPGYAVLGIAAPILLTLCRLTQGFVASAEFAGSAIFLVEHADSKQRGFWGCLSSSAYCLGMLLGTSVCALFTQSWMPHWAWRLPFLLAACGGALIWLMRTKIEETPVFEQSVDKRCHHTMPFWAAWCAQPKTVLATLCMAGFIGVITYGSYVYMVTYLHLYSGLSLSAAMMVVSLGLLCNALVEPMVATKVDKIGWRRTICLGSLGFCTFLLGIYLGLHSGQVWLALLSMCSLSILIAVMFAPTNALLVSQFAPQYRYSGYAVSFNLGISLFGATTPLMLSWLLQHHHAVWTPVLYDGLAVMVGLLALCFLGAHKRVYGHLS